MGYNADEIKHWSCEKFIDGKWVLSRPLDGPFLWRLKDAWNVLLGKADALYWKDQ